MGFDSIVLTSWDVGMRSVEGINCLSFGTELLNELVPHVVDSGLEQSIKSLIQTSNSRRQISVHRFHRLLVVETTLLQFTDNILTPA